MNENIFKALGVFIDAMRLFTISVLQKHFPDEPWEGVFFSRLSPGQQSSWNQALRQGTVPKNLIDYHNLTFLASAFRDELAEEMGDRNKTYRFGSCIGELQETRNKCQHYNEITPDERARAFSNMITVANMLGMRELRDEIDSLSHERAAAPVAVAAPAANGTDVIDIPDRGTALQPWFAVCTPNYDISNGMLDESTFAADLSEVARGTSAYEYGDAVTFFSKTYVTAGMREIISRVVRALSGEETENRVISLQTGFGGGKTHTLIALYHIAKNGTRLLAMPSLQGVLPQGQRAAFDSAKVAVFTNNSVDAMQGRQTPDGITIRTLWGQIAYEIGGKEGYEMVRTNDEARVAPSSAIMRPILERAGKSLILIDELADYCVKAAAVGVGNSTLYVQTNSFVQTLTETVAQVAGCVLIVTLPASATEVADSAIGTGILQTLEHRLTRIATAIKPVDDMDVYEVVRRRLFKPIDNTDAMRLAVRRYKEMYHNRRGDLPQYCDRTEYARKMAMAYPFQPELIEMLRQRWGSYHNFQRTRGVLRLLASIVQDLWRRRHNLTGSNVMIHTSDVCLENLDTVRGTVTRLAGPQWEAVMAADIYGAGSNARRIDEETPDSSIGRHRLTGGVATTLLMASIGVAANKGLTMRELKLCLLRPNAFNHSDVDTALNRLEQTAHYLHSSRGSAEPAFWFETRANINILLNQAEADIKSGDIDNDILRRLNKEKNRINTMNVLVNPTADVPEQRRLTLVVLPPSLHEKSAETEQRVRTIAMTRGNSNRTVRNTLLFMTCSEKGLSLLSGYVRGFLACDKVAADYGGRLEASQTADINKKRAADDRAADEALGAAYNVAIRYTTRDGMQRLTIDNPAADFATQVNTALMDKAGVNGEGWILTSLGSNMLRRNNLLPADDKPAVRVRDVYEAFLCYDDKPMITGAEAVKNTVNRYCTEGLFNVAVRGADGHYTRIYHGEAVPFLDVENEDYEMVAPTVTIKTPEDGGTTAPGGEGIAGGTEDGGRDGGNPTEAAADAPVTKTYREVVISGAIPMENYHQIFPSFINILRSNDLKIELRLTARSTPGSPLADNTQLLQKIKESASQLHLDFEAEE